MGQFRFILKCGVALFFFSSFICPSLYYTRRVNSRVVFTTVRFVTLFFLFIIYIYVRTFENDRSLLRRADRIIIYVCIYKYIYIWPRAIKHTQRRRINDINTLFSRGGEEIRKIRRSCRVNRNPIRSIDALREKRNDRNSSITILYRCVYIYSWLSSRRDRAQ